MKRIISIILVIATIAMLFTGCTSKEDLKTIECEATIVDVSKIAENKALFENRVASIEEQNRFKSEILNLIEVINKGEINDFTISFSKETFKSWEECNDYAQKIKPGETYLGSNQHYLLWLAQRIINNEVDWKEICDTKNKFVTVAFAEKNSWVGTCSDVACIMDLKKNLGQAHVFKKSFHAFNSHKIWQACVVEILSE